MQLGMRNSWITKPLHSHDANIYYKFLILFKGDGRDVWWWLKTIKLQLQHWSEWHRCVARWPQRVTLDTWSPRHDDTHIQNTAPSADHPLHHPPQYSDQFSRQIKTSYKYQLRDIQCEYLILIVWFSKNWRRVSSLS